MQRDPMDDASISDDPIDEEEEDIARVGNTVTTNHIQKFNERKVEVWLLMIMECPFPSDFIAEVRRNREAYVKAAKDAAEMQEKI